MIDSKPAQIQIHSSRGEHMKTKFEYLDLVQVSSYKVPSSSLSFLEKLRSRRAEADHIEKIKIKKSNEGITFNQGHLEDSLQHKIFNKANRDKQLVKKFEQEIEKELKLKKQVVKSNLNSRIKIPNIIIFENNKDKMIHEWETLVNEVVKEVTEELGLGRVNYNYNRTLRKDRITKEPLDYAIVFFDQDDIAAAFMEIIDGKEFYGSIIRCTVLPPRR